MDTQQVIYQAEKRPKIVCLCGSTRFGDEYQRVNFVETLKGNIVLSVGCFGHQLESDFAISDDIKIKLDELHKRKIDLADAIIVICPGGYIGESTRSEIAYAEQYGKTVIYAMDIFPEPINANDWADGPHS